MDTIVRTFNPDTDVAVNQKFWRDMPQDELDAYIDFLVDYFTTTGYPYYEKQEDGDLQSVVLGIEKYGIEKIIERIDGQPVTIRQTMHGLASLWSYFPHYAGVKCNNAPSPLELFNDKDKLRHVIKSRLKFGSYMAKSSLRKALRLYCGGQAVSNFRPTAAAAIYQYAAKLMNNSELVTWDMSAGFGGRMMGAFLSGVVKDYIGCDPSTLTMKGLYALRQDLHAVWYEHYMHMNTQLFHCGSENMDAWLDDDSIDLCFTSPPYFNTEKYSDEDTQSWKKYQTYNEWIDGYWKTTVKNCKMVLKDDGLLIVNIAPIKNYKKLHSDVLKTMQDSGFELVEEMRLQLSGRPGTALFKYEPIYIMRKSG